MECVMRTIDQVLPLIGNLLDEQRFESLFGERGFRSSDHYDPSHPQDQRHYYTLSKYGLQCVLGDGDIVETIFFFLRGKKNGGVYPWAFGNGLNPSSSRSEVLRVLGTPEKSAKPETVDVPGCVGWDRFRFKSVLIHVEYNDDCSGISMITGMLPATAPSDG
jgi:hypothetical protein